MNTVKTTNRSQAVADKELDKLFEGLVPAMGKADTKAGEIVRATMRLVYRWHNDGDMLGCGYGKQTCNPAGRFLVVKLPQIASHIGSMVMENADEVYETSLLYLQNYVIDFINANPQLKEEPNEENYLD